MSVDQDPPGTPPRVPSPNPSSDGDSPQASQPAALTPPTPVADLLSAYDEKRGEIAWWLDAVKSAFERVASRETRELVHSVRSRLKDRDHLKRKIANKRKKGRRIEADNFFDEVEDLAGVRVITLYRRDVVHVHEFVANSPCWKVLHEPDAYACLQEDIDLLRNAGLNPREPERGYTSIHYVVGPKDADRSSWLRCEIQLRSLHMEGWAEVDHRLRYPDTDPGPVAREILRALHNAASVTDWLASIARQAADHQCRASAELRKRDEAVSKLEAEVASLRRKLKDARSLPALGELTLQVDSIASLLPAATSSFFVTTCPSCGAPTSTFLAPRTCAKCGKTFCESCSAAGPYGLNFYATTTPMVVVGPRYEPGDLCRDCAGWVGRSR